MALLRLIKLRRINYDEILANREPTYKRYMDFELHFVASFLAI